MKKVGIITITNSGMNFGNRLQNFALQQTLEKMGVCVETIYSANEIMNSLIASKIRRQLKKILKHNRRRHYFNRFDKLYINKAEEYRYGNLNDTEFSNRYDAFIAGSDQVWNPGFHFNSEFEFMTFAPPSKRFSYAASFGVDEVSGQDEDRYKDYLKDMASISVREFSGCSLVKNLTGRDANLHVDPVLLLEKEAYLSIEEKPPKAIPDRYILTYMLGHALEEYQDFIQAISEELDAPIIELSELPGTEYYHIGPQHFLYLIRNATYICTDSFHGTAFCTLFEKQFTVFKRKCDNQPMDARITTILEKMQLQNRRFGSLTPSESVMSIEYAPARAQLEKEKLSSKQYLASIINKL